MMEEMKEWTIKFGVIGFDDCLLSGSAVVRVADRETAIKFASVLGMAYIPVRVFDPNGEVIFDGREDEIVRWWEAKKENN